jgi:hypothetical protein
LSPHDVLVVIVSDFFGVDARTEYLVTRIAAHNDILGVLVHDPMRVRPAAERLRVGDGSRQLEIDLRDARLRDRLVNDYRDEQHRITHLLRRLSAPLLMISNEGDLVEQVRRLLGVPPGAAHG